MANPFPVLIDSSGAIIAQIDDFLSLQWERQLASIDGFAMELPSTSRYATMVQRDMLVIVPDVPPIAYLVEDLDVVSEGANSSIEIGGRSIDALLGNPGRLCLPPGGEEYDEYIDLPAETIIKQLVDANAGPGAAAEREIPNFAIATDTAEGDVTSVYARYESVLYWVEALCLANAMGWEVAYDYATNVHTFDVIIGQDRSGEVFFDVAFDAITAMEWIRNGSGAASLAVIGGAGEGSARTVATGYVDDAEPTGLLRREIFVDGGNVDDADALVLAGQAELSAAATSETFKAQIAHDGPYAYRTHWDLGDFVRVRDARWGINAVAQVIRVIAKIRASSVRPVISVELGEPAPTLEAAVLKSVRREVNRKGNR